MQYFLSPLYVKQNTPVGDSVDDQLLTPLIRIAAENWIRPLLGTYFFDDLLTKYNGQTLGTDEETLIANYVKPAVAWRTAGETIYAVHVKIRNKGLQVESGEFSQPADSLFGPATAKHYRSIAENYENQMIKWLSDNKSLFSTLTSDLNTDSIIKNSYCGGTDTFKSGIFFI